MSKTATKTSKVGDWTKMEDFKNEHWESPVAPFVLEIDKTDLGYELSLWCPEEFETELLPFGHKTLEDAMEAGDELRPELVPLVSEWEDSVELRHELEYNLASCQEDIDGCEEAINELWQ